MFSNASDPDTRIICGPVRRMPRMDVELFNPGMPWPWLLIWIVSASNNSDAAPPIWIDAVSNANGSDGDPVYVGVVFANCNSLRPMMEADTRKSWFGAMANCN